MYKFLKNIVCILCIVSVSGCTTLKTRKINFNIVAVKYLNIDVEGKRAPVVLGLYQLSSTTQFEQASYFSIIDAPVKTLGATLLEQQDLEIRPSERILFSQDIVNEANYLGVVAGFRDLDQAIWRQTVKLPTSKKTNVNVLVSTLGIKVTID